jgi:hypothetical protein
MPETAPAASTVGAPPAARGATATPAALRVRFDVVNPADGSAITGREVAATAEEMPGRWFAESTLDIGGLPAGRYTLRVAPVDPATGEATKGMTRTIQIAR